MPNTINKFERIFLLQKSALVPLGFPQIRTFSFAHSEKYERPLTIIHFISTYNLSIRVYVNKKIYM